MEAPRVTNEVLGKALSNIQRIDPCANKVLMRATHTALYTFETEKKCWEKTEVDGAFFIYQRCDKPFFSVIIANRQSLSDFIEPITDITCVQANGNYMYMKKIDGKPVPGDIKCIWFYRKDECEEVSKLIEDIVNDLKQGKVPPTPEAVQGSPVPEPPPSESNALLEMLKAAQKGKEKTPQPIINKPDEKQGVKEASQSVTEMPTLLQKLMIQEQPQMFSQPVPTTAMMSADELEKDLFKDLLSTARPKQNITADMVNSSAVSLANFSVRSVHGSEFDAGEEVESVLSTRVQGEDPGADEGSGSETSNTVPPLNKDQFVAALIHLLETDDAFGARCHNGYIEALNRRLNLDNQR